MMSDADLHLEIGQWLYGVQPPEAQQPVTFADLVATWRERGGAQFEHKYQTDPSFRAVLDAATWHGARLEKDRAALFAALAECWRLLRNVGWANPEYPRLLGDLLNTAWFALSAAQRPGDPPIAD